MCDKVNYGLYRAATVMDVRIELIIWQDLKQLIRLLAKIHMLFRSLTKDSRTLRFLKKFVIVGNPVA